MTKTHSSRHLPLLAGLLSLILPGLGQVVLRRLYRGVAIFLSILVVGLTVAWYGEAIWYLAPAAMWLWSVWDAVSLAGGRSRSILIPVIFGLIAAYGIGWQVVEIDFASASLDRAAAVVRPMLHPDFIEPRRELNRIWVNVSVPCPLDGIVPAARREVDGKVAVASPDCATANNEMAVTVSGMWPDSDTEIWWETSIGDTRILGGHEDRMLVGKTDSTGSLTAIIKVPSTVFIGQPDPTITLTHRVYFDQYHSLGGYQISTNGGYVFKGMLETVTMALMATTLAIFLAVPLGFLAAYNLMRGNPITFAIYVIVRTILNIFRSIESLIIAIVFVKITGLGPFAGVMALAIHSVAALAKLYSEVIEGIDPGPIEAIRATGANWVQVVRYGVIPQIVPPFTSFTIYRWDINVRSATVIGMVGGGGIGLYLIQWIQINELKAVSAAFIAIAVVVILLDYFSAKVRERLI